MALFTIDPNSGLLSTALLKASPNCDARPAAAIINLLVIHNISLPPGEFLGNAIDDLFLNRLDKNAHPYFQQIAHLRVSAHLLIRRDGIITQYVPFHKRAWHAGVSQFAGKDQCNDYSIGIELEGCDDIPYTYQQYQQLACVTRQLMQIYPGIQLDRIVGHCDIAPQRKTDPGNAFNWDYYRQLLVEEK